MSEKHPPAPRPIRVDALAEHTGLSVKAIRNRIRAGEIDAIKVGRSWLIPASELARLSGVEVAA